MAYTASDVCQQILNPLRTSNLNFLVTETPYSAQITIRKRFLKSTSGPQTFSKIHSLTENSLIQKLEEENSDLKLIVTNLQAVLTKSEANVKISNENCVILEQKIDKIESDALDAFDENKREVNALQTKLTKLNSDISSLKGDLNSAKKIIKEKEKEVKKLGTKVEIAAESVKKYKAEKAKVEQETETKKVEVANVTTNTEKSDYNMNLASKQSLASTQPSKTGLPPTHITSDSSAPSTLTMTMSSPTLDSSTKPMKSAPVPTHECSHYPQCMLRHPNPPPPFAPITFDQFYNPPKPPIQINLLPTNTLSFREFCDLENMQNHQCEECAVGMLYHNYTERVEYQDPGPSGGFTGVYRTVCPNSPKATIFVNTGHKEDKKRNKLQKKKFKCDICSKNFEKSGLLSFHVNRMHARK